VADTATIETEPALQVYVGDFPRGLRPTKSGAGMKRAAARRARVTPSTRDPFVRAVYLVKERVPDVDGYPFSLPAVRSLLRQLELHPRVTFFIGENGSGKSTLIEAIAIAAGFNAEGGSRNFRFATRSSESALHDCIRLVRGTRRPRDGFFLRAESYFNVATQIERLDAEPGAGPPILPAYGGRSLHEQSHGESFFALLQSRFRGDGFYVLDEPEAALSPTRQLAFLARLDQLVRLGSQFVIATHSPILMAYPQALLFELGPGGIRQVAYEDTEHFRVTRDFLLRKERMLRELFADRDQD
jgi:predicted ATPase